MPNFTCANPFQLANHLHIKTGLTKVHQWLSDHCGGALLINEVVCINCRARLLAQINNGVKFSQERHKDHEQKEDVEGEQDQTQIGEPPKKKFR